MNTQQHFIVSLREKKNRKSSKNWNENPRNHTRFSSGALHASPPNRWWIACLLWVSRVHFYFQWNQYLSLLYKLTQNIAIIKVILYKGKSEYQMMNLIILFSNVVRIMTYLKNCLKGYSIQRWRLYSLKILSTTKA